jgi:hypothetical protein
MVEVRPLARMCERPVGESSTEALSSRTGSVAAAATAAAGRSAGSMSERYPLKRYAAHWEDGEKLSSQ